MTLPDVLTLDRLPAPLAPLRDDLEQLEQHLQDTSAVALPALRSLLDLVFASGGKRIRPALVFACARLGRADPEHVIHLAAAIETLHAASLVHDDLIDESLVRRGMPTLNTRWGASATVLAGDWLFARAAGFAADTESVPVVKVFARTLMTLADGELRQLFGRSGVPSADEYEYRIYAKTASLFEAATECAAELVVGDRPRVEALARFGRELGNAFQIADDILDFTGDAERLGKPVGSDLRSGQVTLPVMLHLARHPGAAAWLAEGRDAEGGEVEALIAAVCADEDALVGAWAEAAARRDRALRALDVFPPGPARDDLASIAGYAVERTI
jgi:geranylgeranyl pyrophosphate synthase